METSVTEHPSSTAGYPKTSTSPPNGKVSTSCLSYFLEILELDVNKQLKSKTVEK